MADIERDKLEKVETVEEWRAGDPTPNDIRMAELIQLAQDRQIEINVWRGRHEQAEDEVERLRTWQKAYAKGRAGLVEQADQDFARANEAEATVTRLREAADALLAAYDRSGLTDLRWFVPYVEALRDA